MTDTALERPGYALHLGDLLRLLALPIGGFIAFGVGLAIGMPPSRVPLFGVTVATAVLVLAPVFVDSVKPYSDRHLLLSIFCFSYLAHFVVPVFANYLGSSGYREETFANMRGLTPEDIAWGELAALVGFASLLAGYVPPVGRWLARTLPRMEREWSLESCLCLALIMIPIGWTVFLAGQFGVIPKKAGSGVLGTLAAGTNFGLALLAIAYLRHGSNIALAMLGLLVPPTMIFNFFTSSKQLFLTPLAMVVTAHIMVTRRLRVWWLVGFVAAMSLLYPVAQTYRDYLFGNHLTAVQVISSPHRALGLLKRFVSTSHFGDYMLTGLQATSTRLDGVVIASTIVRDAGRRVPFQHGWTLSYIVLSFIPRVVWPGKPDMTIGRWVTTYYGSGPYIISNTGPTWIGELYLNFGWWGILVGMGLVGVWFRFLQESFLNPDATIPALLAGVIALFATAPELQGQLAGPITGVIFLVGPIMLVHAAVRALTRRPPPLPRAV